MLDFTAWFVMQGHIAAMHQPQFRSRQNDRILELILPIAQEASKARLLSQLIISLPYSLQYKIGGLVTNSHRLRHYYLRKQVIEKHVRTLLESGEIKQIVSLGAGMDVLNLCYARDYPNVNVIEIDREGSQQFKIQTLKKHDIKVPENIELVGGDLLDSLGDILLASSLFKKDTKTLWLAEGLFMFIPERHVARIFQQAKDLSAHPSAFTFTTLCSNQVTLGLGHMLQRYFLNKESCPFEWTISFADVENFVAGMGYQMDSQIKDLELHKDYAPASSLAKDFIVGENIHFAMTAQNVSS